LFEKRVRKTIRLNRLLAPDDTVAVGLSGEKDSATAAYVLGKLAHRFPKAALFGVTVDMGVKGYSKKVVESAGKLCRLLEIEHRVVSLEDELGLRLDDVPDKAEKLRNRPGTCTWCSALRRRVLNNQLRALGATKLATGHNLDDEVQTFWVNMIRSEFQRIARMGAFEGFDNNSKFVPRELRCKR